MDKNREAFEAWFNDPEKVDIREAYAWKVWQASRQALEVDLENVNHVQVVEGTFYLSEIEVNEHLTSLGIRVNGNEE